MLLKAFSEGVCTEFLAPSAWVVAAGAAGRDARGTMRHQDQGTGMVRGVSHKGTLRQVSYML